MSKGKTNTKNNKPNVKPGNIPVKSQPMKPKGGFVKKANFKSTKPLIGKANDDKTVVPKKTEIVKKPIVMKEEKKKEEKKVVDIAEDEDDDDCSDDEELEDDDSDMDDIDLMGDSDDEDLDMLEGSDDEDDDSVSFEANSDQESIEIEENPKKNQKEVKEIAKKDEKKPAPIVVKIEDVKKPEPTKKSPEKPVQKKELHVKTIDQSTPEGKLLVEINRRKNDMNDCVVFIKKVQLKVNRDSIAAFLAPLSVIHVYVPKSIKSKKTVPRGYGYVRAVNAVDAGKMIEKFTKETIEGCKVIASKFVCKKVYNDAKKIDYRTLLVQSSENVDISDELKKRFPAPIKVWKFNNTQYTLNFPDETQPKELFNKGSIDLKGKKILFNYIYHEKNVKKDEKVVVESKKEVKEETKPTPVVVKAGVKRTRMDSESDESDSEEEEKVVLKKTKMNDGTEAVASVTVVKETPKKSFVKTPESKKTTPQLNNSGKKPNQSPKNFNNNKKGGAMNRSFNKSPGNKKPAFNKK